MFSRKHFRELSYFVINTALQKIIRDEKNGEISKKTASIQKETVKRLAIYMGQIFEYHNKNFDWKKWKNACGI